MDKQDLLCVDLPWAAFGLVIEDDHVVRAAPIAKYTLGWHWTKAAKYFAGRGGTIVLITNTSK